MGYISTLIIKPINYICAFNIYGFLEYENLMCDSPDRLQLKQLRVPSANNRERWRVVV